MITSVFSQKGACGKLYSEIEYIEKTQNELDKRKGINQKKLNSSSKQQNRELKNNQLSVVLM